MAFSPGTENTTGKQIVKALSDALFYIQPHLKTLHGRINDFIPAYFTSFMHQKVYNDPKIHKHTIPPIKREALEKVSSPLYALMLLPLMQTSKWHEFFVAVDTLAKNIQKYKEYLQQWAEKMTEAHRSPTPIRSFCDASNVKFVLGAVIRGPNLMQRYRSLEEQLLKQDEPVFLNDFAPINSRLKYCYLHELSLPFKVEVYTYHW